MCHLHFKMFLPNLNFSGWNIVHCCKIVSCQISLSGKIYMLGGRCLAYIMSYSKIYSTPTATRHLCNIWNSQWKLEARGPFIAHLITNSKQFSQKKDHQNDRIQINACVVGNTSVCCYEHLVLRRLSSNEKPFLYLFLPALDPLLENLAETTTRMAAFQVKPFVFEALFDSFLPCLGSTPARIW